MNKIIISESALEYVFVSNKAKFNAFISLQFELRIASR